MLDESKDLFLREGKEKEKALYFVCGPSSFMIDIKNGLISLGIRVNRIKIEVFGVDG